MGKRNSVVILSSDDEDDTVTPGSRSSSRRRTTGGDSKSSSGKGKSGSGGGYRCRGSGRKKARVSEIVRFNEFESLYEDFSEDFAGFKVSAGFRRPDGMESWVDKHRPQSLEDLAVNKKKVEEVKLWFDKRVRDRQELHNQVLLITGPAGVGKSVTIQVIASQCGATLCEWNTPTPTIWREHVYNSNSEIRYLSKLDDFENFVERAAKYGLLPSSTNGSAPVILLIDDLPVTNGRVAYHKLLKSLKLLVNSAQTPTVILVTDYGRADSSDSSVPRLEDLSLFIEECGACKVAFNPITVNLIKKTLSKICILEQCQVSPGQIDLIANASGGDIRHAITSLQYFCINSSSKMSESSAKCRPDCFDAKSDDPDSLDDSSLSFGRDQMLSLFHALGKFLHNKREIENAIPFRENAFPLKERFTRLPMKMNAPEKILCQAYGEARPVSEFLHENVLDFVDEEAIDDAWTIASYLGDADCLLSSAQAGRSYEAENVLQSAAASVAVRGVLFGNVHPAASRWHTIRRPNMWIVDQRTRLNKYEMEKQRLGGYNGFRLCDKSVIAIEYRPILKWLGYRLPACNNPSEDGHNFLSQGRYVEGEAFDLMSFTNQTSADDDEEEDDIEDW
ncbi:hypothetical protein Drorol1_Dr00022068 [Drosera rotundifolia]